MRSKDADHASCIAVLLWTLCFVAVGHELASYFDRPKERGSLGAVQSRELVRCIVNIAILLTYGGRVYPFSAYRLLEAGKGKAVPEDGSEMRRPYGSSTLIPRFEDMVLKHSRKLTRENGDMAPAGPGSCGWFRSDRSDARVERVEGLVDMSRHT